MTIRFLFFIILLWMPLWLSADQDRAAQLVSEAWSNWERNDHAQVEAKFKSAIEADSQNTRAYLGLSYLYALQQNYPKSWQAYQKVISTESNYYPYLFAAWSTAKFSSNSNDPQSGIQQLWERLSDEGEPHGVLQAMSNQDLGQSFREQRDLERSTAYYSRTNALRDWTLIGPFDNVSASGFDKAFPPEERYRYQQRYSGKNGIEVGWNTVSEIRPDTWIDFRRYFAYEEAVFYGNTFVQSPEKQSVNIRVGTSGSLKLFLNDEEIMTHFDENNNDLDTYIVKAELQKGWNRLLIKCGFSEINQCNFLVRITDDRGGAIPGLRVSAAAQRYPRKPGVTAEQVENFAEVFFRRQIEQHPEHLENYLLLADCYLRNDKAIEGELVLLEAIRRAPGNAVFLNHIVEAYTRGEKFDEISTTMEKFYRLDPNAPQAVQYKYSQYLENEQLEQAEQLLSHMAQLIPESATWYELAIALYSQKRDIEKILATSSEAYQKHPDNWTLVSTEASISFQKTRSYFEAIQMFDKYLSRRYTITALNALADAYLKASDVEKWEESFSRIFQLDPSATGFYFQMANTYFSLQEYGKAEQMIRTAIDICANSSEYWAKLGEIQRAAGARTSATSAYREALRYDPANYSAREILRELEDQPSIFSNFEEVSIEELLKSNPQATDYPSDDALILLKNINRVVYRQGASERTEEMLVKIFNSRGLDDFKEYWIEHNGYLEGLTVERAVVLKPDGSEIKADVNRNHLVFKSLEENDLIHIRWRTKNFYSGKLSNHFWDQVYFNGFYPVKDIRYSLLVPEDLDFKHNTQHMPNKPRTRKVKDGKIFQWRLQDEPGIVYEYGMPILDDVGKVLHISSIDDWEFMVDWYLDIAQTKTRSSHEVKAVVRELFAGEEQLSDQQKVQKVYNYITENIRYSSVSFRQSGLVPQKARDVLVNRIGDCKDVSTLCIAMLREAGVNAHYVLVNTRDEGYNDNVLPSIAFNHCITGVELGDDIQYLDLTANNYPYGAVPPMDMDGFSLLIKPGSKSPAPLKKDAFLPRKLLREMRITLKDDNALVAEKHSTRTGALAATMRSRYRQQSASVREKALLEVLTNDFLDVKLNGFSIENLDSLNQPLNYDYTFEVPEYVSEIGRFRLLRIPWTDNLESDRALSYESRQYPYYYWPPADTLIEELELTMPSGYEPLELGEDVQISCSIAEYSLTLKRVGRQVIGRRMMVNKQSVVKPEDYQAFRKFYNTVVKQDARQILLQPVEIRQ